MEYIVVNDLLASVITFFAGMGAGALLTFAWFKHGHRNGIHNHR